jgi:maltose O-acetyltransferase
MHIIKLIKAVYRKFKKLIILRPSDPFELADWYRKRGVQIGERTKVYSDVVFGMGGLDPIIVGRDCVLTGCTILGHDASTNYWLNIQKSIRMPTVIGDRCFIGTRSIVLMGVHIGDDCIVGAGAIVTRDIASGSVVAGNPAKIVGKTAELVEKRKKLARSMPEYFRELPYD